MKIVLCNAPKDVAPALAKQLLEANLAACINLIGPVRSLYRWQGETCDDEEMTLLIKVAAARAEALREALVEAHPYEVPEVLFLAVDEGLSHGPYIDWVRGA